MKDESLLQAIKTGVGNANDESIVYETEERLFILLSYKSKFQIVEFHGLIWTKENYRKHQTTLITHLLQLATGDDKFYVDDSGGVHNPGQIITTMKLGDHEDDISINVQQ